MVFGYYINLKKSTRRNNYMIKQIKNQKINLLRFEGYDLKENTDAKLNILISNKIIKDKKYITEKNKIGSVASLLAHTTLWEYLLINNNNNNNNKSFLILEDDCKLCDNFNEEINFAINKAPEDWDMLWFGYNNIKGSKISEYYYKPDMGYNKGYNTQHHCYLIKVSSINKLINILIPLPKKFKNKDTHLRENFDKFNAYFYFKKLGIQDIKEFPKSLRTNNLNG